MIGRCRWLHTGILAGLLLGGCAPARPRLAVFAVVDAARGDRMSYAGYERQTTPFLDSLAEDGALIALQHFSQGAATRTAVPRLFYSRYFVPPMFPASPKVPIEEPIWLFNKLDGQATSLPGVFAGSGFHTVGVSAHSWIRPGTDLVALFDEFHDLSWEQDAYPEAPKVVDTALSVLGQELSGDTFLYLHFMDTHWPYRFGERAAAFYGTGEPPQPSLTWAAVRDKETSLPPSVRDYYHALYDGGLRRVDDELSRLMSSITETSPEVEVSLVVTSDHGEHLGEVADRSTHGGRWFDVVAHIPLLVSAPAVVTGQIVVDNPTESVDVLPTLVDLFGLTAPDFVEFDGQSLVNGETDGIAMAPGAIRTTNEKVLGHETDAALWLQRSPEFFLLESDPLELHDRSGDRPDRVQELRDLHRRLLSHSYHRFRNSRTDKPPSLPFAIASKNFGVTAVGGGALPAGWDQVQRAVQYRLSCVGPPCAEVEVSFPLPDGEYLMSVGYLGTGEISVVGGEREGYVALGGGADTPPADALKRPWKYELENTAYGSVRVSGQTFTARVRTPGGPGLSINYLGFVPDGSKVGPDQESYEARLQALGYL